MNSQQQLILAVGAPNSNLCYQAPAPVSGRDGDGIPPCMHKCL